jgi:hypothetical protein
VGRHPNTSLHLTARTGGAFPKAVSAAGELGVTDIQLRWKYQWPEKVCDIIIPGALFSGAAFCYENQYINRQKP